MDGILPSNEGRGYVLRRLLRRAVRHARMLGIEDKFLAGAVDVVAEIYSGVYDELTNRKDYIKKVISLEEDRFATTLTQGMDLLNAEVEKLKAENKTVLDGEVDSFSITNLLAKINIVWSVTAVTFPCVSTVCSEIRFSPGVVNRI